MRLRTSQMLAIGLATVLSVGPLAQAGVTPVGTLSGNDKVKLNGMSLTASQPALPGDTVEAPGAAMASLQIAPNGVARLTAAGKATVERSGQEVWLNLQNGYMTVHEGDQPMSVRAHGGKISGTPGTVFDVAQYKDNTTITVVKGSVVLSEGGLLAPRNVAAGQNVLVAFAAPGPMMAGSGAASYDPAPKDKDKGTCNDPCKGTDKKACSDFKATKEKCGPMQKACAKDSSKCADYQSSCSALAGCKGWGGLGGSTGAAGAAGAGAAAGTGAAAGAAAATTTAVTATVITAAAAAATAVGVAVGVAASGGNLPSCASTSPANPGTNCTN